MKVQKNLKAKVLFNASVILSGLHSPNGGSAKVLKHAKEGKIDGIISEIILDEVLRHANKVNLSSQFLSKKCHEIFDRDKEAPSKKLIDKYSNIVADFGDRHVLATAEEHKVKYLLTLDKKHLLILNGKIKGLAILRPEDFIRIFEKS